MGLLSWRTDEQTDERADRRTGGQTDKGFKGQKFKNLKNVRLDKKFKHF